MMKVQFLRRRWFHRIKFLSVNFYKIIGVLIKLKEIIISNNFHKRLKTQFNIHKLLCSKISLTNKMIFQELK
jgi:hypothetical protein